MLLSRDALTIGRESCRVDDFYKPAHAHIFDAISALSERGEPADPVTVADELRRTALLDPAGGLAALVSLQAEAPASSSASRYAATVKECSLQRQLISVAGEIAEMGYARGEPETILDQAEQMLYLLHEHTTPGARAEALADVIGDWLDRLEDRYLNGTQAISTGLTDLDEILNGGLRPEELIAVGGRPGSGKSLLGVQVGYHIADTYRTPSLAVSAEMPKEQYVDRLVAAEARIDNTRIRTGRLTEDDWPRVSQAVAHFEGIPLYIYDQPGATLAGIRTQARRVAARCGGLGTIIVDYLQLLTSTQKAENRQVEVDMLTKGLKQLARDLKVPVIALCQLNRNLELRADKRPVLSDFRESGGVENHSDIVIGVYRDEMYDTESADRGTAELIVLKQRNGPQGRVQVAYLSHHGRFANMARM